MADGIEIKVTGLEELEKNFELLQTKAVEKIIRKALRKGGKLMQAELTEAAPTRPDLPSTTALPVGALKTDIQVSVKKTATGFVATVGPGSWTEHAARFTEYGHRMVTGGYSKKTSKGTRGPGKEVGFVAARPWVRPTFERTADSIAAVICDSMTEDTAKAALDANAVNDSGQ